MSNKGLNKLTKKKHSILDSVGGIQAWLEINHDSEKDVFSFKTREDRLKDLFSDFNSVQDEIEFLDDSQESDRALFEENYFATLSKIQNSIKLEITNTGSANKQMAVKLPEISINKFSGQVSDFESFYELFDTLIIKNQSLSDIQRFLYLKSYLQGDSLKLVDSLKVTNENFSIALDILKNRYQNKVTIINSYLTEILDIPTLRNSSPQILRNFLTTVTKNMQLLKNLQFSSSELIDIILVFLLQSKLDFSTRRLFETERNHTDITNLDAFLKFLEKRCIVLESLENTNPRQTKTVKVSHHAYSNNTSEDSNKNNISNNLVSDFYCIYCKKQGHKIYKCQFFKNIQHDDKIKFVNSKGLCVNCLGRHNSKNCSSKHGCTICKKRHNTVLHISGKNYTFSTTHNNESPSTSTNSNNYEREHSSNSNFQGPSVQGQEPLTNSFSALSVKNSNILLATAKVTIFDKNGSPLTARLLLDTGSQNCFCTRCLADRLGYRPYDISLNISGIGQNNSVSKKTVNIKMHSNYNKKSFKISCAILENITCNLPQFRILTKKLPIPGDLFLADDSFHKPSQIDILVGSDLYYDLILPEIIPLGPGLPILQASHLGYLIAGVIAPHLTAPTVANNVSGEVALLSTCSTDELLTKFWNMEELSQKPILSEANELAEQIFQTTTKILENGRFDVDIPLKSAQEHQLLGDSFSIAKRRFLSLENKFQKDKKLFFEYKNFIDTYISSGHAEYVPLSFVNENSDKKYFIPHLCVINEQNKSSTLRVVMDASCKTSTGKSLNDISLKGYQLQPDLFDILVRFRQYKFIFSCDIQKMFRQTWINKDQRFLQNILWRDDTHDSIKCIQLNTVTYGTNSAPFLATRVLQEISNKNKIQFPLASHFLETQFYVDDGLCGSNNIEELLEILQQLNSVLNCHGFTLHKFHSNSSIFLQKINPKHSKNTTQEYDLNFDSTSSKVLGLKWNPRKTK
ncbi:uncharacterized protein [Diabrotica undecimpunctata]|uniref:uncharacterized protein n=1 Tax=Diabrotica undecimpunctata TaxID=50387 RepID=UPI003B63EB05